MGISPPPIPMGQPSNAVKRSRRKYHYSLKLLSRERSACPLF